MKQCIRCGSVIEDKYNICPLCSGQGFNPVIQNQNQYNQAEAYTYDGFNQPYAEQEIYDKNYYNIQEPAYNGNNSSNGKKSKGTKNLNAVVIICIVALIVASIVCTLLIIKPWNKKQPVNIYRNLLEDLHADPVSTITSYTDISKNDLTNIDIEKDSFSIVDVNSDEKDELIVKVTSTEKQFMIIFTADESSGEASAMNVVSADTEFRDNCIAVSTESNDTISETIIHSYDKNQGCYETQLEVKNESGIYSYREYENGNTGNWIISTETETKEILDKYLTGNEIVIEFKNITKENIESITEDNPTKISDVTEYVPDKLEYKTEKITLSDIGECYYEKITFSGPYAGIDKINKAIEDDFNLVKDGVDEYEENSQHLVYAKPEDLYDTYDVSSVWNDEKHVSICIFNSYYAGGMHPGCDNSGKTFDLETGKELTIFDYFSSLSRDRVFEVLDEGMDEYFEEQNTADGTSLSETAKNFLRSHSDSINYYVTEGNIHIIFNIYEINCYAAGDYNVTIPIGNFKPGVTQSSSEETTEDSRNKMYVAYQAVLNDLINNPADYGLESSYTPSDLSENRFVIVDIDVDGKEELVIDIVDTYFANMRRYIYKYDESTDKAYGGIQDTPWSEYYKTGYINDVAPKNHSRGDTIHPHTIRGNGINYYFDCADKYYFGNTDVVSEYYIAEDDFDNDGVVYYRCDGDYNIGRTPITKEQYENYVNTYIPEDQLIELNFKKVTTSNINSLV